MSVHLTVTASISRVAFLADLIRDSLKYNADNLKLAELIEESKNNNLKLVESVGTYAVQRATQGLTGDDDLWLLLLSRIVEE